MLSVVTPVYNGEAFIYRCYHMLQRQTVQDWEWVVVDDGSTDQTLKLLQSIKDRRVRVFHHSPNRGRGYARTIALAEARGDWTVVWDVDDLYFPDRLEHVARARDSGYDFCCSYAALVDNDLRLKGVRGFYLDPSGTTRQFVHTTAACRTALARQIGYDPSFQAGEDASLVLTLARRYHGMWIDDALIANQEDREISVSKTIRSNQAQLRQAVMLYRAGVLDIGSRAYARMVVRWTMKLCALQVLRLLPGLYRRTVKLRDRGTTRPNWSLADGRSEFISDIRAHFTAGHGIDPPHPT